MLFPIRNEFLRMGNNPGMGPAGDSHRRDRIYGPLRNGCRQLLQSVDVGNTTSYTVSNLIDGQIYYFSVISYDAARRTKRVFQ